MNTKSMDVILLSLVKMSQSSKERVVLSVSWAYMFIFTISIRQDRPVAAPPMSSRALGRTTPESVFVLGIRLANTNNSETTKVEQIVTMNDDAQVERTALPGYVNIGGTIKDSGVSSKLHDLKAFLSRPLVCFQGTWTSISGPGAELVNMQMPTACFSKSSIQEKLRGFYGFRAKMVVEVQINAQRFQQGRLVVAYMPNPVDPTVSNERISSAFSRLQYITQLPHVDLDCTETAAQLEVPYVSPQLYYDLTDGRGCYGSLHVFVYSPIAAVAGPLNCDLTVWCHFEDIEVVYPTIVGPAGPLVAQAGVVKRRKGAGVGQLDSSSTELASRNLGPISTFLNKVSTAAGIVAEVPLISSFAFPVAWVSDVFSRSAQVFGLSKPTVSAPPKPVQLRGFAQMNNFNSADHSMKMGLAADNALQHMPGFAGSNLDEMSIPYLCGIPAFVDNYYWNTTQAEGYRLIRKYISPCAANVINPEQNLFKFETLGTHFLRHTPPFSYIAHAFRRWRGGITFTFKVVKTEFHSGRLLAVFVPLGLGNASTADDYTNSQYCYRQVFDLRESSEFTITVPYVNLQPWTDCINGTGYLNIYILNELKCPDSVNPAVDILVEISGAPDMEFQFPTGLKNLTPAVYLPPSGQSIMAPSGGGSTELTAGVDTSVEVFPQSGLTPANYSDKINPIDHENVGGQMIEPLAYCVGEAIRSLRQLMKRYCCVYETPAAATLGIFCPFANYLPTVSATTLGTLANHRIDMLSYFGPLFAFNRGSVRYKVMIPALTAGSCFSALLFPNDNTSQSTQFGSAAATSTNVLDNRALTFTQFSGGIEVEVPAYQRGHCRFSNVLTPTQSASIGGPWFADQQLAICSNERNTIATTSFVYRAIGDDYSLGFFIGTLPLVT